MNRKLTAWKKSRNFGDIYGGRTRRRMEDNIFSRAHSLKRPVPDQELPVLIEESPSRGFFFPLEANEALTALKALPKRDYEGITHIWLKRVKAAEYDSGSLPLAEFICGSGVRALVLYPWPKNLCQNFGQRKPSKRTLSEYEPYGDIRKVGKSWILKWQLSKLRKFYINVLLYHEVGHHIDKYYREWSKANSKQVEEFADQYAIKKTATATHVFNKLEKTRCLLEP